MQGRSDKIQSRIAKELAQVTQTLSQHVSNVRPQQSNTLGSEQKQQVFLCELHGLPMPYEDGTFTLEIRYPLMEYPYVPMQLIFKTRIYHPQVNSLGLVSLEC